MRETELGSGNIRATRAGKYAACLRGQEQRITDARLDIAASSEKGGVGCYQSHRFERFLANSLETYAIYAAPSCFQYCHLHGILPSD